MKVYCIVQCFCTRGSVIYESTATQKRWYRLYVKRYNNINGTVNWDAIDTSENGYITNKRFLHLYGDSDYFSCVTLSITEFEDYIAEHFEEFL